VSSKWSVSFRYHHQNPVCISSIPNICYMNRPSHSSRFDHPKIIWWEVQIIISTLCSFSPLTCYLVALSIWTTKFHTHTKPRAKLYFCISQFLYFSIANQKQIILHRMIISIPCFNVLLISSWIEFWFVSFVPKYLNSFTVSQDLLSAFIMWGRPAFWSRDMTMYLVLSAYISSPVSLLLTYLILYSMEQSPSWEANRFQLVKKFPACYGTRMFITAIMGPWRNGLRYGV